jgi:hypothetical protein
VLLRLADHLEARQARRQFTLALIYPALVTGIALAVIAVCYTSCRKSYPNHKPADAVSHAGADAASGFLSAAPHGCGARRCRRGSRVRARQSTRVVPRSACSDGARPRARSSRRRVGEQRVFPPVLIHLTANGEASGQLAPMLERAARELEREAGRRISWFAALLQPALIVMMGAIVLILVLAVMLPIVSMNQLVR